MSHNLIETDSYPSAIPVPDPGDGTYPTVVPDALGNLANRTHRHENVLNHTVEGTVEYLTDTNVAEINSTVGTYVPITSRASVINGIYHTLLGRIKYEAARITSALAKIPGGSSTSRLEFIPVAMIDEAGDWVNHSGNTQSNAPHLIERVVSPEFVKIPLPSIPAGSIINSVYVICASPISHGGSFPATKPKIYLYSAASAGSASPTTTLLGEQEDASASVANFEQRHTIQISGLSVATTAGTTYFLSIRGEQGANAQAESFRIFSVHITFANPT